LETLKVDDGSDQDHDSHIMVWQIRRSASNVENSNVESSNVENSSVESLSVAEEHKTPSPPASKSPFSSSPKSVKSASEHHKSPSFGQRVLQSISPSLAQKTMKSLSPMAPRPIPTKSPSPFSTSTRSSSSSVDTLNETIASEHVSLAREVFETPKVDVFEAPNPESGVSVDQTSSYLRWNSNVESMMEYPEPGEDFTQLPSCGTPSFDRGLN